MNISNTSGPPITAMVPERTPACSQAASNEAPAGFHKVALGFRIRRERAIWRVTMIRFRFGEFG